MTANAMESALGEFGERVLAVLETQLSKITAEGILKRASQRAGIAPSSLEPANIEQLFEAMDVSINLFVSKGRQAELRAQLRALSNVDRTAESESVEIENDRDVAKAIMVARRLAQAKGTSALTLQKIMTVVSELARNIVLYADRGLVELPAAPSRSLRVRVLDDGPGISNLDQILEGNYRSRTGLGKGLRGVSRMADHIDIQTGPKGTCIEVEFKL